MNTSMCLPVFSLLQDSHWVQALGLLDRRDAVLLVLYREHYGPLLPRRLRGPRTAWHGPSWHSRGLRWCRRWATTSNRSELLLCNGLIFRTLAWRAKTEARVKRKVYKM